MECTISATRATQHLTDGAISYLDWGGSGAAVLLLHGITSNANTFWRIAAELSAAGYRVVVPDMPGHGLSAVSSAHAIDAIAAIIGELMLALDLQAVTVIGHSWGGATALALVSGDHAARQRVQRVALLDPLLAMDPAWGEGRLPDFSANVGQPAHTLYAQLRSANPDWPECDIHWKAEALEQCRLAQVAGLFVGGGVWRLIERIATVQVPLLILVADAPYAIITAEVQAEVRANLPANAHMQVIPGTTHNMLRGPGYLPTMAALRMWA
jgi:pimeloyl-ACP methyl ester carboxylesterase